MFASYHPGKLTEVEMCGPSDIERVVAALKMLAVQSWPESARLILKWNDVAKTLPGVGYEAFFHAHRLATRAVFNDVAPNTVAIDMLREHGFTIVVDAPQANAVSPSVRIEVGLAWLDLSTRQSGRTRSIGMYQLPEDDGHC